MSDKVSDCLQVGCMITMILCAFWCGSYSGKKSVSKTAIIKELASCFSEVNWNNYGFLVEGTYLTSKNGEKTFYETKSIDKAIKKFNKCADKFTSEG